MRNSCFIVFEGGDGSGKTTQINLLYQWFRKNNYDVVVTKEPGGTKLGESVRNIILHGEKIDPKTEALLYAADRAHHVNTVVRPALQLGKVVLSDRYFDSSVAYQGYGRRLGERVITDLNVWATDNLQPDLVIVLDIDPENSMVYGVKDNIENQPVDFHKKVREFFLKKAEQHDNYVVINAKDKIDSIHKKILDTLQEKIL